MKKLLILGVILGITACRTELGDAISLALIERVAKTEGRYCYVTDDKEMFCMHYRGTMK